MQAVAKKSQLGFYLKTLAQNRGLPVDLMLMMGIPLCQVYIKQEPGNPKELDPLHMLHQ